MNDSKSGQFNLRRILFSYGFYIVLVGVFIIYSLGAGSFLTVSNLANILRDIAPLLVIASGLTLVIVTGSLDISVGSIALASAAAGVFLTSRLDLSTPMMILIALAVGTCLGAINGFLIVVLRINALVTTLGMMIALRGIGLDLLGGSQWMVPDALVDFTRLKIGPIYSGTIVALVIAGVAQVLLTRTVFGRHLAAIGNSPVIAARLGVRVRLTTFAVFVLSGFLASAGGDPDRRPPGSSTSLPGPGARVPGGGCGGRRRDQPVRRRGQHHPRDPDRGHYPDSHREWPEPDGRFAFRLPVRPRAHHLYGHVCRLTEGAAPRPDKTNRH